MEDLYRLAASLDAAAAAVASTAGALRAVRHDSAAFGADAPGLVGELGRALHGQWAAALCARESEARWAAARLVDTAAGVARAARAYAGTDAEANRRLGHRGR